MIPTADMETIYQMMYQTTLIFFEDPVIRFLFMTTLVLMGLQIGAAIIRMLLSDDGSVSVRGNVMIGHNEIHVNTNSNYEEEDDDDDTPIAVPEVKRVQRRCGGCGASGYATEPCRYCGEIV